MEIFDLPKAYSKRKIRGHKAYGFEVKSTVGTAVQNQDRRLSERREV